MRDQHCKQMHAAALQGSTSHQLISCPAIQGDAALLRAATAGICCLAPSLASCLAMASFSLEVRVQPGDCSPSRSVVSKMRTCRRAAAQHNCETNNVRSLFDQAFHCVADCEHAAHDARPQRSHA